MGDHYHEETHLIDCCCITFFNVWLFAYAIYNDLIDNRRNHIHNYFNNTSYN